MVKKKHESHQLQKLEVLLEKQFLEGILLTAFLYLGSLVL